MLIRLNTEHDIEFDTNYPFLSIFNRLTVAFPSCCPFLFDNHGAVLIDASHNKMTASKVVEILQDICIGSHCAMGIGHSFTGTRGIRSAFKEATTVLRYLTETNSGDQAVVLSDVIIPIIELSILDSISVSSIVPAGLQEILDYDAVHRTELYATLRAYIETNCSSTKAASVMHIGRSTFQYRYEKISSFLKLDPHNPEVQLILRLSFKLIDRTNKQ